MSNIDSDNIKSDLLFKKQDEFWEEYFRLRKEANSSLIKIYTSQNFECVNKFFSQMGELLNWSSSYQTKKLYENSEEDKNIKLIDSMRNLAKEWRKNTNKIWNDEKKRDEFANNCQDFWDEVAEEHKIQELLPRPEESFEEDNIFRKAIKSESNLAMKELYKAVNDIVQNSIKTHER